MLSKIFPSQHYLILTFIGILGMDFAHSDEPKNNFSIHSKQTINITYTPCGQQTLSGVEVRAGTTINRCGKLMVSIVGPHGPVTTDGAGAYGNGLFSIPSEGLAIVCDVGCRASTPFREQ